MLHRVALYGMNVGPIEIETNGEEALIKTLAQRFQGKSILFDVGANKGDYTLTLVRHFGSDATIFAFEPSVASFKELSAEVSNHHNVRIEQIGLGHRRETANLHAPGSALASINRREIFETKAAPPEQIELMRVDDYCRANEIERINLLKLDVEGSELSILRGCNKLLEGHIDVIQFEFGGCDVDSRTFLKDFFDALY